VRVPSGDAGAIERRLRSGAPPIIGRVREGRLLLDLRTVLPDEESTLAERLAEALAAELAGTTTSD
jgi:L-seryl-tRNA(Ser) seleniumtransferase